MTEESNSCSQSVTPVLFEKMQLLLALLFAIVSCVGRVECKMKSKIIGGWHVSIKDVPYRVAIAEWEYCRVMRIGLWVYRCGGSIINEWWILTAAHCINVENTMQGMSPEHVAVAVGRDDRDFNKQWLEDIFLGVKRVVLHPQYFKNSTHSLNDIGLLRLSESLVWSDRVQPVVLPSASYAPQQFSQTCFAGTGFVSPKNRVKDKRLKVVCSPTHYCSFGDNRVDFKDMSPPFPQVCWPPRPNVRYSHACFGDSGDGLMKKLANKSFLIVGVTTNVGDKCLLFTGFIHVAYYISWIRSIIEEVPSQKQSG